MLMDLQKIALLTVHALLRPLQTVNLFKMAFGLVDGVGLWGYLLKGSFFW
jgi:hypothetical protein